MSQRITLPGQFDVIQQDGSPSQDRASVGGVAHFVSCFSSRCQAREVGQDTGSHLRQPYQLHGGRRQSERVCRFYFHRALAGRSVDCRQEPQSWPSPNWQSQWNRMPRTEALFCNGVLRGLGENTGSCRDLERQLLVAESSADDWGWRSAQCHCLSQYIGVRRGRQSGHRFIAAGRVLEWLPMVSCPCSRLPQ
jgi:hypothetical protein